MSVAALTDVGKSHGCCWGGSGGTYKGYGVYYMEFGGHEIAKIDVTFQSGIRPAGSMEGPTGALAAEKVAFGAQRIQR